MIYILLYIYIWLYDLYDIPIIIYDYMIYIYMNKPRILTVGCTKTKPNSQLWAASTRAFSSRILFSAWWHDVAAGGDGAAKGERQ
jgi:hypothetical protein